jgi:EAL domain-containing protein (putative c-di-GMP-specific phosphodiesterase class I)
MASDLGIMVVAEAIEIDAERRHVLDRGIEFGQGYPFCKPGPVDWESKVLSTASDRSDLA